MRIISAVVLLIAIAAFGFNSNENHFNDFQSEYQDNNANIEFEWAFGVLGKQGKTFVPIPIRKDTVLKTGDEMKMMVKLKKDCFVYVIYKDSQGEISLLFPYKISQFQTDYVKDKSYYIPKARGWMVLDTNKGKETFFLIASNERLLDLEVKLGDYLSAEQSNKKNLADALITEIRDLRRRNITFATIAEKPLTIGGNIRGTDTVEVSRRPDVADIATKIEANNFYSKTFTIDHK